MAWGWRCSRWWGRLGRVHDRLSAGGVLAGEGEQGAQQDRRLGGVEAEPGEDPPVLEVAEAVPGRGAGGGRGLAGVPLGRGRLAGRGGFPAGDDDRVFGAGVQAGEPEAGQGAGPGGAQMGGEVAVPGGVISLAAPRRAREIQIRLPLSPVRARNSSPCLLCVPLQLRRFAAPGRRRAGIKVPPPGTTSPPCLPIAARARSRRGARAAGSLMISQVQRLMVEAETPLPPAMPARR